MARAGLTGERLAAAGAELADVMGFDQVTVSALARHFNVQVASLYSHVRNSDDLKTRIATRTLTELADQAAEAVAGRAGRDALTALANVYRTYAHQHPGRYAASRYLPPAPSQPTPSQPTPSQPTPAHHPPDAAPPAPTPSQPTPSQPAPSQPIPSQPISAHDPPGAAPPAPAPQQRARRTPTVSVLGTEYLAAGRRHSELMRAVLRAYDLDEPAETDAVRLLGSVIHGYVTLEQAGSFSYSQPDSSDSWPRILTALDTLLRTWS